MIYQTAFSEQGESIYRLVQHTIGTIYPNYYGREIVDFFCDLHSKEAIAADIEKGEVSVLIVNGSIVGTGCRKENHITRVYVSPEEQDKGYGSYIMAQPEKEIARTHKTVYLDASLPAKAIYEHRGYKIIQTVNYPVSKETILVYDIMEKEM